MNNALKEFPPFLLPERSSERGCCSTPLVDGFLSSLLFKRTNLHRPQFSLYFDTSQHEVITDWFFID